MKVWVSVDNQSFCEKPKEKDIPRVKSRTIKRWQEIDCGRATARKIGEQAEARICIGRRVLYSVDKVKQYPCNLSE